MPAPVPVAQLFGCLSQTIPLAAIRAALTKTCKGERRRRALPAALVAQLVIGLGLVADAASRQVLAYLLPAAAKLPTKKSISRARYRLGPRPLIELFRALALPLATRGRVAQAFYRGLRLVALDATVADLPDTPANERIFGRRKTPRGRAAFPQAILIILLEVGVHAFFDLSVRPHRRHELIPGLALVRRSVCRGMLAAAVREGIDPDRLSFKNALVIVRRHLPEPAHVSKRRLPPF
ncbi:MAG: transposase domain-containing protein [bacterium]|nr:transposase domain-containing protein [bacterium]